MFIRAYLRASTDNQDANRAKDELQAFTKLHSKSVASFYIENISGTTIDRPELSRLIEDSQNGDVLLIEKMDRLTRLPYEEWKTLKSRIQAKGLVIVSVDQPMTHTVFSPTGADNAMTKVLTEFMMDLGAAMARDDYETRMKRTRQGIEKAKTDGKYKGRKTNTAKNEAIEALLLSGKSWANIIESQGCSRGTVAKVAKLLKDKSSQA